MIDVAVASEIEFFGDPLSILLLSVFTMIIFTKVDEFHKCIRNNCNNDIIHNSKCENEKKKQD